MSLKLYFLRHGETIYSETGAYGGEVDAELTPEGTQMAEAFAKAYRSVPWTAAFVSPMKRTIATAKRGIRQPGVKRRSRFPIVR